MMAPIEDQEHQAFRLDTYSCFTAVLDSGGRGLDPPEAHRVGSYAFVAPLASPVAPVDVDCGTCFLGLGATL